MAICISILATGSFKGPVGKCMETKAPYAFKMAQVADTDEIERRIVCGEKYCSLFSIKCGKVFSLACLYFTIEIVQRNNIMQSTQIISCKSYT